MILPSIKKKENDKWGCGCAIINKEGKFLLGLRCKKNDLPQWCFPGGKVEIGENPSDAIIREVKEESNLTVKNIEYAGSFKLNNVDDFIFICNDFVGELIPQKEEIKELKWFSIDELKDIDVFPYTVEAFKFINAYKIP